MANNKAKVSEFCYLLFLGLTLILSTVCSASAERTSHSNQGASPPGELLIENGTISADLKEVPLRKVLEQVREQANVWYKCDENLLREKVSIQIKDLPLKTGMRRILASFDHALESNARGELIGLTLLGESGSDRDTAMNRNGSISRVPSRNTLGTESAKTTNVVDLTRQLPVRIIDRKERIETSLQKRWKPSEMEYVETVPEVNTHVTLPINISTQSDHIISLPVARDDSLDYPTSETGLARGESFE